MRKITLFFLAFLFVLTSGFAQTLTQKYSINTYSWNTGNHSRDMSFFGDAVYVIDKNTKAVHKINAEDGIEVTDDLWSDANFSGFSITYDDAGNSYVTSGAYGMTNNIQGTLTVGTTSTYKNQALTGTNRIDYVEAYGDFSSSGMLAGASTATGDVISVWEIKDGEFVDQANPIKISGARGWFAAGSDIKWIDGTKILVTGQSQIPAILTIDLEAGTATKTLIGSVSYAFGGSAYFEILGTPYVVLSTNGFGSFKVFDITNPASPIEKAANINDIGSLTNGAVHVGLEAIVSGNKATIYVWSPNNGLAAHEFVVPPTKTFTVTAPRGTEKVYIAGSFTGKDWDINDPYELTATENPNEFTGTFPCGDDVEYKYLCHPGNWDYQEAGDLGSTPWSSINPVKPAEHGNRTYNEADVINNWVAQPQVKLNVSFNPDAGVPTKLFVKGSWDNWTSEVELTAAPAPLPAPGAQHNPAAINEVTFTGVIGDGTGFVYSNTAYKYYTKDLTDPEANWEANSDGSDRSDRWSIYPLMNDEILRFKTNILTSLDQATMEVRVLRTSSGISVQFDGEADIELYGINGQMIDKTRVSNSYDRDLERGNYIIRVNGTSHKFAR